MIVLGGNAFYQWVIILMGWYVHNLFTCICHNDINNILFNLTICISKSKWQVCTYKEVFIMGMVEQIQNLSMPVQNNYNDKSLVEALDYYHHLVKNNIMKPRENQLAAYDRVITQIKFNVSSVK